jgi:hypothetical protein
VERLAKNCPERLLRLAYSNAIGGSEFASLLDRITKLSSTPSWRSERRGGLKP